MTENANRIKNKVLAIFKRYVKGEVSADEERFVERFYEQVGKQTGDRDVDFNHLRLEQEIKEGIDHQISRKNKIVRFNQNPYVRIAATLLLICTAAFVIFRMIGADSAPDNVQTAAVTQESPVLAVGTEKLYQLDEDRQNSSSYRM